MFWEEDGNKFPPLRGRKAHELVLENGFFSSSHLLIGRPNPIFELAGVHDVEFVRRLNGTVTDRKAEILRRYPFLDGICDESTAKIVEYVRIQIQFGDQATEVTCESIGVQKGLLHFLDVLVGK